MIGSAFMGGVKNKFDETSLLIIHGIAFETVKQFESKLTMRNFAGSGSCNKQFKSNKKQGRFRQLRHSGEFLSEWIRRINLVVY